MTEPKQSPELALAMYASVAATAAVKALQAAKVLSDDNIGELVKTLAAARETTAHDPRIDEHFEMLLDKLLAEIGGR